MNMFMGYAIGFARKLPLCVSKPVRKKDLIWAWHIMYITIY
jgi:hypothetical protein